MKINGITLPRGLTFAEAARRLGLDYRKALYVIHKHGYPAVDGRHFGQRSHRRLDPSRVDWKQSNIQIARRFRVSRERVRFLRERLGKAAVGKPGPVPCRA